MILRKCKIRLPGWANSICRWLLIAVSLSWVLWLLRDAWEDLAPKISSVNPCFIALGFLLGVLATYVGFIAFAKIFYLLINQSVKFQVLAHYYFSAQLMKHLPGRFFGIGYQIVATRGWISASKWIAANSIHMLLTLYFSVVVSVSALVVRDSPVIGSIMISIGTLMPLVIWRSEVFASISSKMRGSSRSLIIKLGDVFLDVSSISSIKKIVPILFLMLLSWIVYFCAWALYGAAYPEYDSYVWIRICAYYNLAWLIGYLSFMTPSGLGVRELAFTLIADDLSPGALAYAILIGRVSLLTIDLILGLVFLKYQRQNEEY